MDVSEDRQRDATLQGWGALPLPPLITMGWRSAIVNGGCSDWDCYISFVGVSVSWWRASLGISLGIRPASIKYTPPSTEIEFPVKKTGSPVICFGFAMEVRLAGDHREYPLIHCWWAQVYTVGIKLTRTNGYSTSCDSFSCQTGINQRILSVDFLSDSN